MDLVDMTNNVVVASCILHNIIIDKGRSMDNNSTLDDIRYENYVFPDHVNDVQGCKNGW